MNEYKLYELSKSAYKKYCKTVKGNRDTSFELAQRKLTRNILLSLKIDLDKKINKNLYMYGELHIYTEGNKICEIRNNRGGVNWFYKDRQEYERLNEELGINELELASNQNKVS